MEFSPQAETKWSELLLTRDVPRVELFARQTPPGWDVWGNEVEPTAEVRDTLSQSHIPEKEVEKWPM